MAACMCDEFLGDEYRKLLLSVKYTVEGLLASQLTNVWNTYGGLTRLGNDIHKTLLHGLRNSEETADYWIFFGGLRVLQPTLAPALERHRVTTDIQSVGKVWILRSLEEHTLSNQLRILLQDTVHLNFCYRDTAFIRQTAYSSAFLLCLNAVEQNNLVLLAEIEPTLLIKPEIRTVPNHNRTFSLPTNQPIHCKCDSLYSSSVTKNFPFSPSFSSLETISRDQFNGSFKGTSKLKRTESRDCEFITPPYVSRTYSLEEKRIKKADSDLAFNTETDSPEKRADVKENQLNSVTEQIEKKQTEVKEEKKNLLIEIKLEKSDNLKPGFTDLGVNRYNKQRSESGSSYEKHSDQLLKPSLKIWWSNLKKSLSDSQIDTVKLINYKATDTEFLQNSSVILENSIEKTKTSIETLTSLSESVLKVDYPKPEVANTNLSPVKSKLLRRRHDSKHSEKLNDKNASTNTLCAVETSDQLLEDKSQSSQITTEELEDHLDSIDVSFIKSSISTKLPPRWLSHQRSRSDVTPLTSSERHFTIPTNFSSTLSAPKHRRKSLLEGGVISPMTECFFPRPAKGQTLTSFLSSNDFDSCAELDRENNHFSISEALISAIEQMKWAEMMKRMREAENEFDSDEEIQYLKQRIRIRKDEREKEKKKFEIKRNSVLLSDGRTDTTTSVSPSSFGSPQSSAEYPESSSTDSIDELVLSADEADETSQLVALRDNGLSLSMASLYSDADVQRGTTAVGPLHSSHLDKSESLTDSFTSTLSAEAVALSLLKRFPEKQLPKASELQWLVSEQDAPQRLLPLPNVWPVPAEDSEANLNTRYRGTLEWAPPRAQIIFNIHPPPQRKIIIAKQNYRCAGCSMKSEMKYMKRFRYCEYLGKYFCQCCHSNYQAFIPGRILRKWDFSKYYVSNFSLDLLNKMYDDPLFNIMDINHSLYRRTRILEQVRELRKQLYSLKDFVQTCRHCDNLWMDFEKHPQHLLKEIDTYSIYDLVQVKNGEMVAKLKKLVQEALNHVNQCQLCQMKGFICEICRRNDIIFPFHLTSVVQCSDCWACYHKTCYTSKILKCPKCKRIEKRRRQFTLENSDTEL